MTLIEMLSSIEDTRKRRGIRHKMPNFLIMCLTAMMSGYTGYREIGRFLKENQWEFKKYLTFCKVPTYGSIRRIFMEIDFDDFATKFNQWAAQFLPMCQGETLAIDGKAIAGTIKDPQNNYQNFVSLISVFASQRGIVIACDKLENKKESEIYTVQKLLQALDIEGEIITLDALHCQKTLETIVKSKNDYIVQVKGNQKNLFNQIKKNIALGKYLMDTYQEQSSERGRDELRITKVYKNIEGISPEWSGIKRIIETTRYVKKKGEESTEIAYHISSIAKNKAKFFANHIRSHWGIENRLHWVKDTLMIEDKSKTKSGNAPENLSIMRNISINLFRLNGKDSIKLAMEWGISNFKELMNLIYYKSDYNMII